MAESRETWRRLGDLISYCMNLMPEIFYGGEPSANQLSKMAGTNAGSVGRIFKAGKTFPDHSPVTMDTLDRIAQVVWVPMSELNDDITKEPMGKLMMSGEEFRAIIEGKAYCRVSPLEPLHPMTAEVERERLSRRHSYSDMAAAALLVGKGDVDKLRRFLFLGGWAPTSGEALYIVSGLGRYLARVDKDMSAETQAFRILEKTSRLNQLLTQNETNGAAATR